jgi:hypothetical protein
MYPSFTSASRRKSSVKCRSTWFTPPSVMLCRRRDNCCSMFHFQNTNAITVPNSSVHSSGTDMSMPQVRPPRVIIGASASSLRNPPSCVEQHFLSLAAHKLTRCPLSLPVNEHEPLFTWDKSADNPHTTTSSGDFACGNRLTLCVRSYCRYPRAVPLVTCVLPRPSTTFHGLPRRLSTALLHTSVGRTITEDT